MIVIDADAHVEESPATFSDSYLDPAFRKRRPEVVNSEGRLYWRVEDQIYPRLFGRGCHNMGTPGPPRGAALLLHGVQAGKHREHRDQSPGSPPQGHGRRGPGSAGHLPELLPGSSAGGRPRPGRRPVRLLQPLARGHHRLHGTASLGRGRGPGQRPDLGGTGAGSQASRRGGGDDPRHRGRAHPGPPELLPLLRSPGRGGPDPGGSCRMVLPAPEQHVRPPLPWHHPFPSWCRCSWGSRP